MEIIKILPHSFGSNTYIVTADNKNAVVIDPAETTVLQELKDRGLVCNHVLLTHGHFDHVGGCGVLFDNGARIYCGEEEKELIFSKEYLAMFGGVFVPEFGIYKTLSDGQKFELCGINFKVIHTPGHSAGSVCYVAGNNIFSGDTLFRCGAGRCDLPTGNVADLMSSLKKLFSLDGDYKVFCGHDRETTLDFERKYNPFIG